MKEESVDITRLLEQVGGGDASALDAVFGLIYEDLQVRAHQYLRSERSNHTLNTTALVHEAYIKLMGQRAVTWKNRAHFMGVASIVMRRILITHAKKLHAGKRGGGVAPATLLDDMVVREDQSEHLLALDEALDRLSALNERQSKIVEMRYFGGLQHEEIAEVLGISVPTVGRDWRMARAWLNRELAD
ncbi:MAG: sigma-70 family RNA polymerase sigma factor [Rhodothermales bacterium]